VSIFWAVARDVALLLAYEARCERQTIPDARFGAILK
jgi:hypothetical protein